MSALYETELEITSENDTIKIDFLKTTTDLKKITMLHSIMHAHNILTALISNNYLQDTLEQIEIGNQIISDYDFGCLCEYISKCKTIKCLDFSFMHISSNNIIKLANIVKICTTLKSLKIDQSYGKENCTSLLYLLDSITDSRLHCFSMYNSERLNNQLYNKIVQLVLHNSTLVSLTVQCGYNLFDIVDAIKNNKSIEKLNMYGNFSYEFVELFSNMLANNNRLTDLTLNEVTNNNSIQCILSALRINSSLISLHIVYHTINENDISAIVDMIISNTTLQKLYLSSLLSDDSHIYESYFDALEKAVTDNYTLQNVNFLNKSKYATECFERNKTLLEKRRFIATKCVAPSSCHSTDII